MKEKQLVASRDYEKIQRDLHDSNNSYGRACVYVADKISTLIKENKIKTLLDYGAGKQRLVKELRWYGIRSLDYRPYDIAFPEYGRPRKSEMVVCVDVLEHIEPCYLEAVITEIADNCEKLAYITVHTGPAKKTLSDGRNAHLTLQNARWWYENISKRFLVTHLFTTSHGVELVCVKDDFKVADMRSLLKKKLKKSKLSNFLRRIYF